MMAYSRPDSEVYPQQSSANSAFSNCASERWLWSETFSAGNPQLLFDAPFYDGRVGYNWTIHPDGDRFLMFQEEEGASANHINVVLNWAEELKRLAPVEE